MISILHHAGGMTLVGHGQDGPEWHGPCPSCGGSDRFHVWPQHRSGKERYWCRGCGVKGDGIDFVRMLNPKLSFISAQAAMGVTSSGAKSNSAKQGKTEQKTDPNAHKHAKSAALARAMFDACDECLSHGYLTEKCVRPCQGIRSLSDKAIEIFGKEKWESRLYRQGRGIKIGPNTAELIFETGDLVVPIRQADDGGISTLQFINRAGRKALLPGGRKQGGFFTVPSRGGMAAPNPLCIAEGLATALSINEATGYMTIMAIDSGNLLSVARTMREYQPEREIIICADNDTDTPGNPGVTKAREAAGAIRARLYIPPSNQRRAV